MTRQASEPLELPELFHWNHRRQRFTFALDDELVMAQRHAIEKVAQALPARPTPIPNCIGPAAPAWFQPERTPGRPVRPWSDSTLPMAASTGQGIR